MRAAGLTPGDLHDAARGCGPAGLKSWPMRQGGRVVRHTSLYYVREYIAARREEVSEWARRMAAAPRQVQEIERWLT